MKADRRRAAAWARILEVLKVHAMTQHELSDTLFMSRSSVYRFLDQMRAPGNRCVRISAWDTDGTNFAPIYRAGTQPDAKRPQTKTRHELYLVQMAKKPKARRDPLIAWIPTVGAEG